MTDATTRTRLAERAEALKLHGLIEHLDELDEAALALMLTLVGWEEDTRRQRGLERRMGSAHLGKFKALADFDWTWPAEVDRAAITNLMTLDFVPSATNVILVGPNGVGKSTLAQNLVHHAVLAGHTARFVTAAKMLNDLAAQDGASALERRLRHYARPELLVIDELGYLAYGNRHADLLFEIVNRRYERHPIVTPTARSGSGARSSPTLRAWCRSSTGSCTTRRSSRSQASPTGCTRRARARRRRRRRGVCARAPSVTTERTHERPHEN